MWPAHEIRREKVPNIIHALLMRKNQYQRLLILKNKSILNGSELKSIIAVPRKEDLRIFSTVPHNKENKSLLATPPQDRNLI